MTMQDPKLKISKTIHPDQPIGYNEWTELHKVSNRVPDPQAYDRARDMMRQYKWERRYITETLAETE